MRKTCSMPGCCSMAINIDPDRERCDVCYYKRPLLDLLAILHRDGGHYTETHGLNKSVQDALAVINDFKVRIDRLEYWVIKGDKENA